MLLIVVLFAATSILSQTVISSKPAGIVNFKLITDIKYFNEGIPSAKINPVNQTTLPIRSGSKLSSTTTWHSFTSSMNIYGVLYSYCKPLQWNDDLDAVTFIHRKGAGYNPSPLPSADAANGAMVVHITLDCGNHWDSTALYANDLYWGRFPSGAIYNPPSSPVNTNMSNAYFVGAGPTTSVAADSWVGNFYASKQLGTTNYNNAPSTVTNAVQVMSNNGPLPPNVPGNHYLAIYDFTATDDGKMRVLAHMGASSDTAVMLMTGTFNNGVFDWAGKAFSPPVTVAIDGTRNLSSPFLMAWNELGTVGYIVIMGSRIGANASNVGLQPIVYKTTNSGSTWSLESSIDFNSSAYSDLRDRLEPINVNPTLKIPCFPWFEGMDCTVDANNKLHIFTTLLGHKSGHLDSLKIYNEFTTEQYLWRHIPGRRPYLYDFVYDGSNANPSWSHLLIDSMSTQVAPGNNDNPWDNKEQIGARIQMSRTPDGQHLLYSWAESDTSLTTNQKKFNTMPNIKTRLYDVSAALLSPTELDLTSDASSNISYRAMWHFVSPKFKLISKTSTTITAMVPMTITNSNPYTSLSENTHWYSCSPLSFANTSTLIGIAENTANSINNSSIFPNPAKNNVTVNINLINTSKVQIDVLNTVGQLVRTIQSQAQTGSNSITIDLSGLSSGIYFVNIKVDNVRSAKKLVIE